MKKEGKAALSLRCSGLQFMPMVMIVLKRWLTKRRRSHGTTLYADDLEHDV